MLSLTSAMSNPRRTVAAISLASQSSFASLTALSLSARGFSPDSSSLYSANGTPFLGSIMSLSANSPCPARLSQATIGLSLESGSSAAGALDSTGVAERGASGGFSLAMGTGGDAGSVTPRSQPQTARPNNTRNRTPLRNMLY